MTKHCLGARYLLLFYGNFDLNLLKLIVYYFSQMRIGALALSLRIGNDHFDAGQKFARFEQTHTVRTALFDNGHTVIAQRPLIYVHWRWIGIRGALFIINQNVLAKMFTQNQRMKAKKSYL